MALARPQEPFTCGTPSPSPMARCWSTIHQQGSPEARCTLELFLREFWDVAWAGFEAVVGRFILVVGFTICRVGCICMHRVFYKSLREVCSKQSDHCAEEPELVSCQELWLRIHLLSGAGFFHVFSILDHLNAMKVRISPSFLEERHGTCSATGAMNVRNTFTQLNGRLTISNSLAQHSGGAVHLGSPPGGVLRCCLSWLWGCGRSVHFSLCFKFHNMSCWMHLHAQSFLQISYISSLPWKTLVAIMPRIVTSWLPQEPFMWRTSLSPMARWRSTIHRQGSPEARCTLELLLGEFWDVAWSGFEAVAGRFILVCVSSFIICPVWCICLFRVSWTNLLQKIAVKSHIASLKNRSCYHASRKKTSWLPQEPFTCGTPSPSWMVDWRSPILWQSRLEARCTLELFLWEFWDVAWAGFEAVVGRFILVVGFTICRVGCICMHRVFYKSLREVCSKQSDHCAEEPELVSCQELWLRIHLLSGAGFFHVFSILDHLNAMKVRVSPSFLEERHGTCSATGAIFAKDNFTQLNGRLTIDNSSAQHSGGAVHLGSPPGGVLRCCLSWLKAVVGPFYNCGSRVSHVVPDAFDHWDI